MEQSSNQAADAPQPNPTDGLTPAERLSLARQKLTSSRTYLHIGRTSVVVRDDVLGDISKEEASRINIGDEPLQRAQHVDSSSSSASPEKPLVENHPSPSAADKDQENQSPQEDSEPTTVVQKQPATRGRKAYQEKAYDPNDLRKGLPELQAFILNKLSKKSSNSTPSEPEPSVSEGKRRRPRPSGSKRLPPQRQAPESTPMATSTPEAGPSTAVAGPSTRSRTKLLREAATESSSSTRDILDDPYDEMDEDLRRILSPPVTYPLYNGFSFYENPLEQYIDAAKEEVSTGCGVYVPLNELDFVATPSDEDSPEETETSADVDTKEVSVEICQPENTIDDVFSPSVSSTSTPKTAKEEIEYTIPTLSVPSTPPSEEMIYLACVTRGKPLQRQYAMINVLEGLEEAKKPGVFSAFVAGFRLMFGTASVSNAIVAGAQAIVSGIQNLFGYERSSLKRTRAEEDEAPQPATFLPIIRTLPEEQDPETPRRKRARLREESVSVSPRKRSLAPSPPAERLAPSVSPDAGNNLQVAIAIPRKKVDRLAGVYRQGEVPYLPQSQDSGASSSRPASPVRARTHPTGTGSSGVRRSPRQHGGSQPARGA